MKGAVESSIKMICAMSLALGARVTRAQIPAIDPDKALYALLQSQGLDLGQQLKNMGYKSSECSFTDDEEWWSKSSPIPHPKNLVGTKTSDDIGYCLFENALYGMLSKSNKPIGVIHAKLSLPNDTRKDAQSEVTIQWKPTHVATHADFAALLKDPVKLAGEIITGNNAALRRRFFSAFQEYTKNDLEITLAKPVPVQRFNVPLANQPQLNRWVYLVVVNRKHPVIGKIELHTTPVNSNVAADKWTTEGRVLLYESDQAKAFYDADANTNWNPLSADHSMNGHFHLVRHQDDTT